MSSDGSEGSAIHLDADTTRSCPTRTPRTDLLAPRLQAGLQRFAKPWWKRRAITSVPRRIITLRQPPPLVIDHRRIG